MVINQKISLAAIKQGALPEREHETRNITEYVEGQLNKGSDTKNFVTHLEKVKSETVFGTEHEAWDVHTDEPGRWWVITSPTNLYSQQEFPSLDYTLSFHVGVTARVFSRQSKEAPEDSKDRIRSTWRRWENAAAAIDDAREREDFQAIGMMCREALIEFAKSIQNEIPIQNEKDRPKAADFNSWTELTSAFFAAGERNQHIRSYLRSTSKETWSVVNWLTHTSKATLQEAQFALDATANILGAFTSVIMHYEAKAPETCPICKSYRIASVFEPDLEIDPPYVNVCEACDWNSYDGAR